MSKQQRNSASLSRRALIGAAAGPLLAASPSAQNPAPSGDQENEAAAKQLHANFELMRKVPVPMTVEPATIFRP